MTIRWWMWPVAAPIAVLALLGMFLLYPFGCYG